MGTHPVRLIEPCGDHLDGPQSDRITRPEAARRVVDRLRVESCARLDAMSAGQPPLIWIEHKLDDRHRGDRGQVVGVKHSQERIGDLGKFVVDLVMDAGRQIGKRLDQAFNVRIFRFVRFEH
jgi:hypothetical protein